MEHESTVVIMIDGQTVFRKPIGGPVDQELGDRKGAAGRAEIMERFTKIPAAAALEQAELCQTDPLDPLGLSVLGACLAHLNRREEALKIFATLSQMAEAGYVESHAIARLHFALGDVDRAIESVGKSLDEREPFSAFLKLDPAFDPLRGDPRFGELVSRVGL